MTKNPTENNQHGKSVLREIFQPILKSYDLAVKIVLTEIAASFRHRMVKYIMILCYLAGIILTGIGAERRHNSPNYVNWINTIDCGTTHLCGVALEITFSGFFQMIFLFSFVSFILVIFFVYDLFYKTLSQKSPSRCIGCFAIKFVFLLFLSPILFLLIKEIHLNIKLVFYILSLANLFMVAGLMILFYLGLTLNKKPRSNNKNGFWA